MDESVKLWRNGPPSNVNLRMAFYGKHNSMQIGKDVLRVLGGPDFITIRVNKSMDSFIVVATKSKEFLSFRVPDRIMLEHNKQMILRSKSFVHGMMIVNNMDITQTYELTGTYLEKNNAVIFKMTDGILLADYRDEGKKDAELSCG